MSVRIRLKRTGTTNAACYRIVVMHEKSSRDGRAIEELGFYDPRAKVEKIDVERFDYWTSVGAKGSETVDAIAKRAKEGKSLKDIQKAVKPSKKAQAKVEAEAKAKAQAEEEAKAAAAAAAEAAKAAAEAPAEEAKSEEAPAAE